MVPAVTRFEDTQSNLQPLGTNTILTINSINSMEVENLAAAAS
jgi:hypothetical protein